ncbi:GxxExxY protein [Methanooceanicella nereidis]|uniref:GxxExxY protein n=1 Tax=Methanooceanicella nereidis TaxID=2052831 RepID=UPI0034E1A583
MHKAQLLNNLRLSGKRLGLLINFNDQNIGRGITRILNQDHTKFFTTQTGILNFSALENVRALF